MRPRGATLAVGLGRCYGETGERAKEQGVGAAFTIANFSCRNVRNLHGGTMSQRYWLVLPDGGRQLIDPRQFDLSALAEVARRLGGRLEVEEPTAQLVGAAPATRMVPLASVPRGYEPPLPALAPMFQARLERVFRPKVAFTVNMNARPTTRVLGGYYKRRRLVRIYTHDKESGRRPLEDLFDTFLHEVAHHLEYTEPESFLAPECGRVPGRMHSPLFWRILGELKRRWKIVQRPGETLRPIDLEG